jgi:hypothetical protein
MAEINLLFQPTFTTIDTLVLDASISESHNSDVDVTEHAVEVGANIADHARVKSAQVTIEGVVSNTPINRAQARRIVESFGTTIETSNPQDQLAGQPGYAEQAFAQLELIRDTSKIIQIVTGIKTYTDMLLTNLSVPRNAQIGESLRFTATFKSVRLVKNQTTSQTVTSTPQGKKKTTTGKQSAKSAADSEAKERTWLRTLSDNTGLTSTLGLP